MSLGTCSTRSSISGHRSLFDDGYAMLQEKLGASLLMMQKPSSAIRDSSATRPETDLTENDHNLLFPFDARGKAKLTYKVLRGYQRANPESFRSQQLCQLTAQKRVHVTDAMIRARICPGMSLRSNRPRLFPVGTWATRWTIATFGRVDWIPGLDQGRCIA